MAERRSALLALGKDFIEENRAQSVKGVQVIEKSCYILFL